MLQTKAQYCSVRKAQLYDYSRLYFTTRHRTTSITASQTFYAQWIRSTSPWRYHTTARLLNRTYLNSRLDRPEERIVIGCGEEHEAASSDRARVPRACMQVSHAMPSVRPQLHPIPLLDVANCTSRAVRRILRIINNEVGKKYSEVHLQAIASLLFLRFLSPALVSPQRSALTLVSKMKRISKAHVFLTSSSQILCHDQPASVH